MGREIERKFRVTNDRWRSQVRDHEHIVQGYLSIEKERTVRVRVRGDKGRLAVKGPNRGPVRTEFEYDIPRSDAEDMLEMCIRPLIEKRRSLVDHGGFTWEIDDFEGANEGLVVAEVELDEEDDDPLTPEWAGEEVTGDPRYYNANLVQHPFADWDHRRPLDP